MAYATVTNNNFSDENIYGAINQIHYKKKQRPDTKVVGDNLIKVQSWTKGWRQIHKIKQTSFILLNVLHLIFCNFLPKTSKFGFWVDG